MMDRDAYKDEGCFESIACICGLFVIVFITIISVSAFANTLEYNKTRCVVKTSQLPKIVSHSISRYGHETIVCEDGSLWDEYGIGKWIKRK